ncbi:transposase [Candidatus Woesearchaeota archaeon]|nr:transposase [Candidatus Woesearchaeota archaeon]
MNREKTVSQINSLRYFIDNSLGTKRAIHTINGFELSEPLLDAVAYNTYVETVGNKADTMYLRLHESLTEMTTYSYLDYIKRLSEKFGWKNKEFVLAFDYTDEEFYGEVQGSLPIQLGHYKSYVISHMLSLLKPLLGEVKLLLFDRGFYDKDLMYELIQLKYPFLIFVPKHKDKKEILYPLEEGEKFTVLDTIALEEMIRIYRKRWRIETGFRVQDEAQIKCKSTEMKIRYFFFMFEQMLQTQWVCFYKEEVSFKEFLIEMHKTCKTMVENPKRSYFKNLKA